MCKGFQFYPAAVFILTLCQLVSGQEISNAEAVKLFNELYGQEIKRVQATPNRTDDVELAGTLLEAIDSVSNQPALLLVICEQAYKLALRHPSGSQHAINAMRALAKHFPQKAESSWEKIIAIRKRSLVTGTSQQRSPAVAVGIMELEQAADQLLKQSNSAKEYVY